MRQMTGAGMLAGTLMLAGMFGGCGGGPHAMPGANDRAGGASAISGTVKLGAHEFGPDSASVNHPYLVADATTPVRVLRSFGVKDKFREKIINNVGGAVEGVETLLVRVYDYSMPDRQVMRDVRWFLAQDTKGHVHILKHRVRDDGTGNSLPARLMGVAAGDPACYYLPRAQGIYVGRVWYWYADGKRTNRFEVRSLSASTKGRSNLLHLRCVADSNGDERFPPSWGGPDVRDDWLMEPTHGTYEITLGRSPYWGLRLYE